MVQLYNNVAFDCCRVVAMQYSTSFSLGISLFDKEYRPAICAVYAFFRYADEIVDTFHHIDKKAAFDKYKNDTWTAINEKFSSNPVLHAFQTIVNECNIEHEQIHAFLRSMETDLEKYDYTRNEYNDYIYGSAEVVGLMCLRIFYKNDNAGYNELKPMAQALGQAFQKINFLRDIHADYAEKGRVYFPAVTFENFSNVDKKLIEAEIQTDFNRAFQGIKLLKREVQTGVYVAYVFYTALFRKIQATPAHEILIKRFRINNLKKAILLVKALVTVKLGFLKP